ncbi:MAG: pyridoxamine 5'-phosphate oxidase [Acidimicrobiia bacterium]|nr:pyridoxamine 5'-phosphate oxidase [Acidimicrobiia bacterium]
MIDIARIRAEYESQGIDVDELHPDPIVQFRQWLATAVEARIAEPNAMVVATVDGEGQPWSRYVLLKDVDEAGFTFYTNYTSNKSRELSARPVASLTFGWLDLRRQVNIAGAVDTVAEVESDEYWALRPRGAQLGSWASRQSQEISDRSVLDTWFAEAEKQFDGGEVSRPPHWGGWRVRPHTIEFWQGRLNRLHDRIRYRRADAGGWTRARLSP